MNDDQKSAQEDERTLFTQAIVTSEARKKLIVAGPGTGKTYTFRLALESVNGGGLVLTFIRNLVHDLAQDLSDLARVSTFHGFCKSLVHQLQVEGLTSSFDYYPALQTLLCDDLRIMHAEEIDGSGLDQRLHDMDESDGVIHRALAIGDYYDATSHTDIVYRAVLHLRNNIDGIPEFPLVVVDEYQDFSALETEFIRLLSLASPSLIAGDDDQALYAFKNASARYIRELAADDAVTTFELPYCSRCTGVVVKAVNRVVQRAASGGHLEGRIDKPFECHLATKGADSEAHPKIIHARCSVERKAAPYVGRYVAAQIREIDADDFETARKGGHPAVLVIGPSHFVRGAHAVLEPEFEGVVMRKSSQLELDAIDGYRRLARDETSRLGWRIILQADPPENFEEVIRQAHGGGLEISELLATEYRERHLAISGRLAKLQAGEDLDAEDEGALTDALGYPVDQLAGLLGVDEGAEEDEPGDGYAPIVCTTLVGAKGLSAHHVFIVGMNNGHFPKDPSDISDSEVCCLLVGLSRTRKQCHLVSCRNYAGNWIEDSAFLGWLDGLTEFREVQKEYFETLEA